MNWEVIVQQNLTKTWTNRLLLVLLCFFLRLVACCIAQDDLELMGSSDPSTLASQVAGIWHYARFVILSVYNNLCVSA